MPTETSSPEHAAAVPAAADVDSAIAAWETRSGLAHALVIQVLAAAAAVNVANAAMAHPQLATASVELDSFQRRQALLLASR